MMKKCCCLLLSVAVWVAATAVAASGYAPLADPVSYTIPDNIESRVGEGFTLTVSFRVETPWYIYAPTGNNAAQGMIETNIIYQLPKGITRKGRMQLPEATFKGGFEVYAGEGIVFAQSFSVANDLAPGEYVIKARILYQACNETICLPPMQEEKTIKLVVRGKGTVPYRR